MVLTLAGLAMTVFPGPAVVVVPVGLAMLAAGVRLACRLVSVSIDVGVDAQRWVDDLPVHVKVLASLIGACLAAAGAALVLQ